MSIVRPLAPSDLLSTSTTQEMNIGAKIEADDGSCYRYVKAGGSALVAGQLQQAPAIVANHENIAVAAAASAGDKSVTVTLGATAATANQYAGGNVVINDANGEGYTYRIASHPAASASASLVLTLEDALEEALTTSSEASLIPNKYNGVIQMPSTATSSPVGVAISDIAASSFGFIKTRGAVSCLADGAIGAGAAVSPSNAVAGAVESGVIGQGIVGNALQAGVDTEYRAIDLAID